MALLERVGTLLRANFYDMIDRAEDPEKMLKQLVLDMENQLLQVKTQVAIAIADQHLLQKKKADHEQAAKDWTAKAALAVSRGRDDMARQALERSLSDARAVQSFAQQLEDQQSQTETLRSNYLKLQAKLKETEMRCEVLVAAHRRARTVGKAQAAGATPSFRSLDKLAGRVDAERATNQAHAELDTPSLEDSFATFEREEQVEVLLRQLKERKELTA